MPTLYHYPLDPFSRRARLMLGELGMDCTLREEKPWEYRAEFLLLNPAGEVPVLAGDDGLMAAGIEAVSGYLDEIRPEGTPSLYGESDPVRAEVRRVAAWFDRKFHHEVSGPILHEKIVRRFLSPGKGGGAPDMSVVRAGLERIRLHLEYTGTLLDERNWLAGDDLSVADLAAAAHLSALDYLGDVPWSENDSVKSWYQRIKSRPSFRPLLADTVRGMPPPRIYADLDF